MVRFVWVVLLLSACGSATPAPAARVEAAPPPERPERAPSIGAPPILPPDGCPDEDDARLASWLVVQSPAPGDTVGDSIELVGRCSAIAAGTVHWRTHMLGGEVASGTFETECARCVATFRVSLPAPRMRGDSFTVEIHATAPAGGASEALRVSRQLRTAPDH